MSGMRDSSISDYIYAYILPVQGIPTDTYILKEAMILSILPIRSSYTIVIKCTCYIH